MKKLVHDQQVRTTMDRYHPKIILGTVEGCARISGWDIQDEVERALENEHKLVWSGLIPACLTSDYEGKEDALRKEHEAYANAVLLEDGEIVEVEGRQYKVRYIRRPHISDPIQFDPISIKKEEI